MRSVALLCLLLPAALSASIPEPFAAAPECAGKEETKFCGNCQTVYVCDSAGELKEKSCAPGEACAESNGEGQCVDETSVETCYCTGVSQCDPFDNNIVMLCAPDGGLLMPIECSADGSKACLNGECANVEDIPPGPCEDSEPNTFTPTNADCSSYAFCLADSTAAMTYDCPANEYFDEVVNHCLAAPPTPCTGCEGDDCPDPNDCTLYHSCQGGVSTSSYQCAEGEYFDSINNECADTSDNCDPRIACAYGSDATTPIGGGTTSSSDGVTTSSSDGVTTPSGDSTTLPSEECSENNAYQMYPDPDNCKMYYQCALMPSGDYTLVHGTCPGKLVYNPDTDLCDLNSNVPDCVV